MPILGFSGAPNVRQLSGDAGSFGLGPLRTRTAASPRVGVLSNQSRTFAYGFERLDRLDQARHERERKPRQLRDRDLAALQDLRVPVPAATGPKDCLSVCAAQPPITARDSTHPLRLRLSYSLQMEAMHTRANGLKLTLCTLLPPCLDSHRNTPRLHSLLLLTLSSCPRRLQRNFSWEKRLQNLGSNTSTTTSYGLWRRPYISPISVSAPPARSHHLHFGLCSPAFAHLLCFCSSVSLDTNRRIILSIS